MSGLQKPEPWMILGDTVAAAVAPVDDTEAVVVDTLRAQDRDTVQAPVLPDTTEHNLHDNMDAPDHNFPLQDESA